MTPEDRRVDSELELERELAALGRQIDYPATPDLVSPVRAGIDARLPGGAWWNRLRLRAARRSAVLALAALLAAAGIVAGMIYGLGGLRIEFVDTLPSVPPRATAAGPLGVNLGLGDQVDLRDGVSKATFTVLLPSAGDWSTPDTVYYGEGLAGGQLSLVYGQGPGRPASTDDGVSVLITEFPGQMLDRLAQKSIGPGTTVEVLEVNGGVGFWIEGAPHVIVYRDPTGQYVFEAIRLVRNSLAWEQAGTVVRIEGDLSRAEALALAASFVTAP
jgi:hypothetical protein